MLAVEIIPIQDTLVLRARGSELLILAHHVMKLKDMAKPRDFSQYFRAEALVNRPARKLFEAWLRKDQTLWRRLYDKIHKEMQLSEEATEASDDNISSVPSAPAPTPKVEVEKVAAKTPKAEIKPEVVVSAPEETTPTKKVVAPSTAKTAKKSAEKPVKKAVAKSTEAKASKEKPTAAKKATAKVAKKTAAKPTKAKAKTAAKKKG